ncbi:helix-turn-helix domain-containing protein [Prosthecobacter sp.]|uniref:helix-turn-helix domain-containing protein n=1 Tax=Prosthecobacter sp. TaxID=1965333 RepID=UPI00248A2F40|nr:helix-turn-helix domain-containing protein [Prosthecobacter sp.]MDI1314577.1 helix-turn-helix domain-containing protein [Prosthecobacter sp.]
MISYSEISEAETILSTHVSHVLRCDRFVLGTRFSIGLKIMTTSKNIQGDYGRSPPTPVTFGRLLTAARDSLALSLDDAAHKTRIHSRMLRWLEEGNIAAFGSITYSRSFIRAYSVFLGLDPTSFLKTLPERGLLGGRHDYRYLTESHGVWLNEGGRGRKERLRAASESPSIHHIKSPIPAGVRAFAVMLVFTAIWSVHMLDIRAQKNQAQNLEPQDQSHQVHAKKWQTGHLGQLHTTVVLSGNSRD